MKIVLSGCSGGGKSTLLSMLETDGFTVVTEPGRQIVKEQLRSGGSGLPWLDAEYFAELCIAKSIESYSAACQHNTPTLFDRSYIDALAALESMQSPKLRHYAGLPEQYPYHGTVYFTPPWEAIFTADEERRHSFADAVEEYHRLIDSYTRYGYRIVELPRTDREARLETLKQHIECGLSSIERK